MTPARKPARSLAARLTLWYAACACALLLLATGFLDWALVRSLDSQADRFLADQVHVVRALVAAQPADIRGLLQEAELESGARRHARVYVRVFEKGGAMLVETHGMDRVLPRSTFPAAVAEDAKPERGNDVFPDGDRPFRAMAARAAGPSPARPLVIQVAMDRDEEEDLLAQFRTRALGVAGVVLLFFAFAGHRIARRGFRPVEELSAAARRIGSETLDERFDDAALPAEIAELARTFNGMLDRLETSFGRLRRFSADLAHELRTPVNNLRGEVEVALGKPRSPEEYREVLASCLEETERLTRIIESLLFLARAESAQQPLQAEWVDVGSEVERARGFYEAAAEEGGVDLRVERDEPIRTRLDRTLFQRALGNLVANALAHTPRGGAVTIALARAGRDFRLEVNDTGGGIAPEHLPRVFDRFYRVDHSRASSSGGVGLGLAIVKSITELHGGSVSIESDLGRGTRVRMALPVDAPEPA
jgi:two-component system, OmpR family, heavy metal sensor histidine kinase CusS